MKILVAVDGSKQALKALERAIELMTSMGPKATLSVINVQDDTFVRRHTQYVGADAVEQYLAEEFDSDLKPARELLHARGVAFDEIRATGELATTLIERARSGAYDMIVMGTKGRGALADMLMGSVATKVVARSPIPVMTIN